MLRRVDTAKTGLWLAWMGMCAGGFTAGCQVRHVRQMYSSEFNCPEEQVSVESLEGDRYRVTGCDPIVYQCISGTCIPNRASTEPAEEAPRKNAEASSTEGKGGKPWIQKNEAGANLVKMGLKFNDGTLFKISSVPSSNGGAAQLVLFRYNDEDSDFVKCDLGILLNGQRLALPATKKSNKDATTMLVLELPRSAVLEFGLARQMTIRACDTRWSLSEDKLAQIHEFVKMYEEEIAWSGDEKSGTAGLMAPASGWANWGAGESMPAAVTTGSEMQGQVLFQLIAPSVFQVASEASDATHQGSAVAISRTDVATNCHVLEGAKKITLKQKEDKWTAQIVRLDPVTDRCVLRVER